MEQVTDKNGTPLEIGDTVTIIITDMHFVGRVIGFGKSKYDPDVNTVKTDLHLFQGNDGNEFSWQSVEKIKL